MDGIEADYRGNVDGTEPSEVFIVGRNRTPVGLVQPYRWEAYPYYLDKVAPFLALPAHATSIDNAATLDALAKSARTGAAVDISA